MKKNIHFSFISSFLIFLFTACSENHGNQTPMERLKAVHKELIDASGHTLSEQEKEEQEKMLKSIADNCSDTDIAIFINRDQCWLDESKQKSSKKADEMKLGDWVKATSDKCGSMDTGAEKFLKQAGVSEKCLNRSYQ